MHPAPERRREAALGCAAAALSGAALFLAIGLEPIWWLAWIAPAPVLAFAHRSASGTAAAAAAFVAWVLGGASLWAYYRSAYAVPTPVIVVVSLVPALVFTAATLLSRELLRRKGAAWSAMFAFPAAWVGYEFLVAHLSPHGTLWNLSYSQMDFLPLVQLAAVTGMWGVTFAVMLIPSAAAISLRVRSLRPLAVAAALVAALSLWGWWRLQQAGQPSRTVAIGLAATDAAPLFAETPDQAMAAFRAYVGQVDSLAREGARLVVLPELIGTVDDAQENAVAALFGAAAARNRLALVVGVHRKGDPLDRDAALLFGPDGTLRATYHKRHLIPGLEDHYRPGDALLIAGEPERRFGVQICKDMDFPALSRAYAIAGAGVLLVPAWDKVADGRGHSRMAVMRGVEFGLGVARAAKQGLLTVSDRYGRIVAETRSDAAPFASLTAVLEVGNRDTPYLRFGDWFAWVSLGLCAGAIAGLAMRPRRGTTL